MAAPKPLGMPTSPMRSQIRLTLLKRSKKKAIGRRRSFEKGKFGYADGVGRRFTWAFPGLWVAYHHRRWIAAP